MKYQLRYFWRKVCHFFGHCPICGEQVMRLHSGNCVCTICGRR